MATETDCAAPGAVAAIAAAAVSMPGASCTAYVQQQWEWTQGLSHLATLRARKGGSRRTRERKCLTICPKLLALATCHNWA